MIELFHNENNLAYLCCRMSTGISLGVLKLEDVLKNCVVFSMSQAWQLGRAVSRARIMHNNVIEAVVQQQNGLLLLSGKVMSHTLAS